MQVLQSLRDKPKAWHLGFAGALISQEREFKALHEVKNMKVGLARALPSAVPESDWQISVLHCVNQLVTCLLMVEHQRLVKLTYQLLTGDSNAAAVMSIA